MLAARCVKSNFPLWGLSSLGETGEQYFSVELTQAHPHVLFLSCEHWEIIVCSYPLFMKVTYMYCFYIFFFVISLFGLNRTALKASITDFDNGIWIIGLVPHWTSLVFYLLDHTCIQIMISDFDLCTQKGEYLFWSWYFWLTVVLNQRVRWGFLFVLFRCTVATIVHVAGPLILIWRESKYAVFRFQTPVT